MLSPKIAWIQRKLKISVRIFEKTNFFSQFKDLRNLNYLEIVYFTIVELPTHSNIILLESKYQRSFSVFQYTLLIMLYWNLFIKKQFQRKQFEIEPNIYYKHMKLLMTC